MLDTNDVKVLEKMFLRQEQRFDTRLGEVRVENQVQLQGVRVDIQTQLEGVRVEIQVLRGEMYRGFEKMRDDIIDVIEQNIQPQLTNLNARVARLERRIA